MSALIKVLSVAQKSGLASWKACQALAEMSLANLMGKDVKDFTDIADQGLGGLTAAQFQEAAKAASAPAAIRSVVQFLQHAMRKEKIHGISLRVYDVLFPLSQLSMNPRNHQVLMEAGLIEMTTEIVSTWRPGLYSAQFSAERGSTYPVLEYASEILHYLTRYRPATNRMIELNLESTCERLIREHVEIVQRHAAKVLWRLRDRDALLDTLDSIVEGVEHMKSMAVRYNWSDPERNMRIKGLLHEEGFSNTLHNALQWLHSNIDSDVLLNIRNMMVGMDKKSLGLVLHQLRRLVQRNKMLRLMIVTRWRRKRSSSKTTFFLAWYDMIQQAKAYSHKTLKVLGRWIRRDLARAFESWRLNVQVQRDQRRVAKKIILRWTHMSLVSAFDQWHAVVDHKHDALLRVLGTWRNRPLSSAFSLWLEHVRKFKQQQTVIHRVLMHWTNRTIAKIFDTWREHSLQQKHMQFTCIKVLKHWTHRTTAAAFESWHAHVSEQKRIKKVCSKMVARMLNVQLARALVTWWDHAQHQRRIQDVCSRVLLKMMNRSLDAAFVTWKDHSGEQKRAKGVTSRILKRWTHRTSAAAFESWHTHVSEQKRMAALLGRMVMRMRNAGMCKAFSTWAEIAEEARCQKGMLEDVTLRNPVPDEARSSRNPVPDEARSRRIMQKIARRWTNMVLVTAFNSWAFSLQRCVQVCLIFGDLSKQMLDAGKEMDIFSVFAETLQIQLSTIKNGECIIVRLITV